MGTLYMYRKLKHFVTMINNPQVSIMKDVHFHRVNCLVHSEVQTSVSTCFTRRTTGTEVQGTIPISVMTSVTSSGGVTSYTRLRRPNEGKSFQSFKCAGSFST